MSKSVPSYFSHLSLISPNVVSNTLAVVDTSVSIEQVQEIIRKLQPCVFKLESNVGVRNEGNLWPCWNEWRGVDGNLKIEHLREAYGHLVVPVARLDSNSSYGGDSTTTMTLAEYLDHVSRPSTEPTPPEQLYLKDWHYQLALPLNPITEPLHFQPDLLNLFWDHVSGRIPQPCTKACSDPHIFPTPPDLSTSDYRFLYLGPKNSFTRLHTDVIKSHSWSTNIVGEKEWWLVSPDQEDALIKLGLVHVHGHTDAAVSHKQSNDLDSYESDLRIIKFVQHPGETVFIPSGWWHQVKNLSHPTLSINCNWFTPHTLINAHASLEHDLMQIIHSIQDEFSDKHEMLAHAQLIMQATSGLDWNEWIKVLMFYNCTSTRFHKQFASVTNQQIRLSCSRLRHDEYIQSLAPTHPTRRNLDFLSHHK